VTYSKNNFVWDDVESVIDELKKALNAAPLPLLTQAEKYRAKTAAKREKKEGSKALARTGAAVQNAIDEDEIEQLAGTRNEEDSAGDNTDSNPENEVAKDVISQKELSIHYGGAKWSVVLQLITGGNAGRWLDIVETPNSRGSNNEVILVIRINMEAPFMRQFGGKDSDEMESVLRLAAGFALSQTIATQQGAQRVHYVLENLNQLLEGELSRPS
jgi:hypothetical protein